MKTNIKYSAIALLALGTIFTSCEKSDLAPSVPNVQKVDDGSAASRAAITEGQVIGEWKITKYSENGSDELDHFAGNIFYFSQGGKLVVMRDGVVKATGRWSLVQQRRDAMKMLYIELGRVMPYGDLTDKWYFTKVTNSQMELKVPVGSGADYLHFSR